MRNTLLVLVALAATSLSPALEYERDIMPIFEKKCADCHGGGESKGGLKLDDPEHLLGRLSKNSLVVPGDWDASYLFITLYRPADHEDAMPPEGKGERLTEREVKMVQDWITEGAPIGNERGERGETSKVEVPAEAMTSAPVAREWTNTEGKTISATLVRVEGDVALLRMANGTVYRYPIANLSEESRAALTP